MEVFRIYLWKEWREQRAALGWLCALLGSLATFALFLVPKRVARDEILLAAAGLAAVLVFLFTIGPDLLGRERQRGRARFLERLPAGLRTAFAAKLVVFVAAGTFVALLGLALGVAIPFARAGVAPLGFLEDVDTLALLVPVLAVATWTFAVSPWIPNGALGLPVAAMILAALGWPLWLFYVGLSWSSSLDSWVASLDAEIMLYAVLSLLGAPVSAWVAFEYGQRFGRGRGAAAWRGMLVAALFLSPGWSCTGWRVFDYWRIDPTADDARFLCGLVDVSGSRAFVTAHREVEDRRHGMPPHALVIDLETGEWHSEGHGVWYPVDRGFSALGGWNAQPVRHAWLVQDESEDLRCFDTRRMRWVDGTSAPDAIAVLPERVRQGIASGEESWLQAGFGFRDFWREGGVAYYDPFRGRIYRESQLFPTGSPEGSERMKIRAGTWLMLGPWGEPFALDPDTGERTELSWLTEGMSVGPMLPDGDLLIVEDGAVFQLDPDTGERGRVALAGAPVPWVWSMLAARGDPLGATGYVFVTVGDPEPDPTYEHVPARYDIESRTLHLSAWGRGHIPNVMAVLEDDTALVIEEERRLVRAFFDGRPPEVLFPRAED